VYSCTGSSCYLYACRQVWQSHFKIIAYSCKVTGNKAELQKQSIPFGIAHTAMYALLSGLCVVQQPTRERLLASRKCQQEGCKKYKRLLLAVMIVQSSRTSLRSTPNEVFEHDAWRPPPLPLAVSGAAQPFPRVEPEAKLSSL